MEVSVANRDALEAIRQGLQPKPAALNDVVTMLLDHVPPLKLQAVPTGE